MTTPHKTPRKKRRKRPGSGESTLVGDFGSRHSGQETGRPIRGKTRLQSKRADPIVRPDPTKEELEAALAAGFCWWCNATHSTNGRQITAWAIHWAKAHGINVRHAQDILEVSRTTSFITEELRERYRERAKQPSYKRRLKKAQRVQRRRSGTKVEFSKYGRKKQAETLRKFNESMTAEERRAHAKRASAIAAANRRRSNPYRPCVICGKAFWIPTSKNLNNVRRTCSNKCSAALRGRNLKVSDRGVRWIRKAGAVGALHGELAELFGISRRHVSRIIAGKRR